MFSSFLYSKSERNFVNTKVTQMKKPMVFFDKNNMIKILSVEGDYSLYELDSSRCKIINIEERNVLN